tara:strand:+ start:211 stop:543 length:333 start_codon:yes stop_codon:yes gene_type:complete
MKLRKLKSYSIRHYDTNEIDKREKRIWTETSRLQKFTAVFIGWMIIVGLIFFIVWVSFFASNLNHVNLNGFFVTQEEYDCLTSGGSCQTCIIDDVNECSEAVNIMHSEVE